MPDQPGTPAGSNMSDPGQFDALLSNGPAQTGGMALVVGLAGQTAAQMEIPVPGPSLAAAVFALLLAVHNIRRMRPVDWVTYVILIPIVTLVLFATGWGGIELVQKARSDGARGRDEEILLLNKLQQENAILNQRLQVQSAELTILRKLAELPATPSPGPSGQLEHGSPAKTLSSLLGVLMPSAHAQPDTTKATPMPSEQRQRLLKELQEYQNKQRELAEETERLRREREEVEKRAQPFRQAPTGLWRKW